MERSYALIPVLQSKCPPDLRGVCLRIKMARRLSRLDPRVLNGILQVVNDTANKTEELLQRQWTSSDVSVDFTAVGPQWV